MKIEINSDHLNRNDIVTAKLDYKKEDWIRGIIIFNSAETVIVHWDWVFYEGLVCGDEIDIDDDGSFGLYETWNGDYSDDYKQEVIALLRELQAYTDMVEDWNIAGSLMMEEINKRKQIEKHENNYNAEFPRDGF